MNKYSDQEINEKLTAYGYEQGVIELVLRVHRDEKDYWVDHLLTLDNETVQRMNHNRRT